MKGGFFEVFNVRSVAKYQKNEGRTLWGHLKIFENRSQKAEKMGDSPVSLSKKMRIFRFEKLVKKISTQARK